MGILVSTQSEVVAAAGRTAADLSNLNRCGFLPYLVSVTSGNIFGGRFIVALV